MIPDPLLPLAESQHGLITATQLRDLGFGPHAFADRAGSAQWVALTDEVLRRAGAPESRGQLALGAVLDAGPGAALAYSSAAAWWHVPGTELEPLHVVRARRTQRRPQVAHLHTVRLLPERWTTVLDGVPIVRPELLAMQLFAQYRFERAERHVDALWSLRLLSGPSLRAFVDEMGARGRNGIGGLRRYLDERGDGYVPPASGLEGRAIKILAEAGIPMRRQVDSGGPAWTGRVDLRHEVEPVIAEVQSERYHLALSDRRDDEARHAALAAAGFQVVELWDSQVWHRPREVVELVRLAVLRARGASPTRSVHRN